MTAFRVLHVSQPTSAGVARWVHALAADQSARGWDVTVASPVGWLGEECRHTGVKHVLWEASRSPGLSTLAEARSLRKIARRGGFDLVHLHSSKAGLAGRLAIRGRVPTIFQPHCWSFQAASGAMAKASLAWEKLAVRWTDRSVCVSDDERTVGVGAGLAAEQLVVIRNGVDVGRWAPGTDHDRAAARAVLGIAPDAPTVVTVGRLAEQKGQDLLLSAWPDVVRAVPGVQLYIVGDGPLRPVVESLASATHGVHLVGESASVSQWYAAADVVTLPSRWEGLALAVLEAAASARSVVASDVSGMSEVIGEGDGAAGVVIALDGPSFVLDLARELSVRLLDPQRARVEGERGRCHVLESFDLRQSLETTATLTAALVRERRMPSRGAEAPVASTASSLT